MAASAERIGPGGVSSREPVVPRSTRAQQEFPRLEIRSLALYITVKSDRKNVKYGRF